MVYFGNASKQLPETLQGVKGTHPDLRKARVGYKDYAWLPWQQQISRFFKDLSENQQFYPLHEKITHFSFVLSI